MKLQKIYPIILLIVAFLQYSNTLNHEFAWDDKIVIEENPRVQKGVSGIQDLFIKYNSKFRNDKYGYRPIVLSSFALDISIGGKKNPGFHHWMNVLYYAFLSFILFVFLKRLFSKYDPFFAFIITLLFTLHPLHTEVVANIKSRDEIFSLIFSVLSFISLLQFIQTKKWWYLLFVALSYLLAYLSKENAILILFVYPIIGIYKSGLSIRKNWAYLSIVPVLIFISLYIMQSAASSKAGKELTEGLGVFEESQMLGNSLIYTHGIINKLANAFMLLFRYIKLFIIPYPLVYFYGYNMISPVNWASPIVWISLLTQIGLLTIGILKRKERPEILMGYVFFLITISLYLHLVRPLSDTMADRFAFTPSLGLCISFIGILGLIFKIDWKKRIDKPIAFIQKNTIVSTALIFVFIIFAYLTFNRNKAWKNDDTLVKTDMKHLENCSRAHFYYATQLHQLIIKNPSRKNQLEGQMIKHYKRSIEITDSAYYAYIEWGTYYCNQYRYNEGIPIFEKAVSIYPNCADPLFFLGQAYVHTEQYSKAIPLLEKSIELAPRQWGGYFFLSISYGKIGKYYEGRDLANVGLNKFPNMSKEFNDALGHIYYDKGDMDSSVIFTLKMLDFGAPPKDVYGRIIGRYMAKGNQEKANEWKEIARQKGVTY